MAVAVDQSHGFKPFGRANRCKLQSFTHLDYNVLQFSHTHLAHTVTQAFDAATNIHRSSSTPCLSPTTNSDGDYEAKPNIEIVGGRGIPRTRALVVEVAIAIASGSVPDPVPSGLGGAYFLHNRNGDRIAVAKPIDEEPLAFNNPKGFKGPMMGQPGMRRSVRVGETGIREFAAYLLDHDNFAGVPPTALVKISHLTFHVNYGATPCYKIASLQRFIDHAFDAGELGSSGFSVASVHRIGILDIRLLNLDRHAGNILVKRNNQQGNCAAELVPIDHGLCLPEWLDDPYFEWLHWPQALVPFSDTELEYIGNLNPLKEAENLRRELPSLRESSIRVLIICTVFLKQGAAADLCLADIGEMMTREAYGGENSSSTLEALCAKAKEKMVAPTGSEDRPDKEHKADMNMGVDEFMFYFDTESKDAGFPIPAKPLELARFSSTSSLPRLQEAPLPPLSGMVSFEKDDYPEKDENGGSDEKSTGRSMIKSMSFSAQNHSYEGGEISFEDMSQGEWELFLEAFEKLVPQAFEEKKHNHSNQRLGSSCEF